MRTLEQFVNECGGRAKASVAIGIDQTTLWRWSRGISEPRGLALRRLKQLGIRPVPVVLRRVPARSAVTSGQNFVPEALRSGAARINKIARFVQIRPAKEAFAKNDEEMLLGMLAMTPVERVADVDQLRIHFWSLGHDGSQPLGLERIARVVRRSDAKE
ncbi:MAG: hypothetical protein HY747_06485 [Elusimicrobia bacterium]|nr:hypothetical protein [Elusimicrobiota bacterium]